jgi:hypothetical protein
VSGHSAEQRRRWSAGLARQQSSLFSTTTDPGATLIDPRVFKGASLTAEQLIGLHDQLVQLMRREPNTAFTAPDGILNHLHSQNGRAIDHLRQVERQVQAGQRAAGDLEQARIDVARTLLPLVAQLVKTTDTLARTVGGQFASDTQALYEVQREIDRLGRSAAQAQKELAQAEPSLAPTLGKQPAAPSAARLMPEVGRAAQLGRDKGGIGHTRVNEMRI